jgi:hypothetical protein
VKIITIRVEDGLADRVVEAVRPLLRGGSVEVAAADEGPQPGDPAFEELAAAVAAAIEPKARQPMRTRALKLVLLGKNTFPKDGPTGDASMRNALSALSKALKPLFPEDRSALDRIAVRKRKFSSLVKFGTFYSGLDYEPTPLGLRVRDLLREKGAI